MQTRMTVDFSEFKSATDRAFRMGDVRKRDITKIFRDVNKETVNFAKMITPKSRKGAYSLQYPSRTHTAGTMRKGMKFKSSRVYKLVYYVISTAWYSAIYSLGHGSWRGHDIIGYTWKVMHNIVTEKIKDGLGRLTVKTWENG